MLGIRDQTGTDPFAGGRLILGLSFQSVSPGLSRIPDPPVRNNSETDEEDCISHPSVTECVSKSLRHVFFTGDSLGVQPRDRPSRSVKTRY